ncbi:MAG: hypothetical protein A2007_03510 [Verrucomicrobia bacterium GWC2_42_7]|nr:MAG: hypothetical protein A2007_03510 [Verrucomicrobia bacterium GWC2_42_7]
MPDKSPPVKVKKPFFLRERKVFFKKAFNRLKTLSLNTPSEKNVVAQEKSIDFPYAREGAVFVLLYVPV